MLSKILLRNQRPLQLVLALFGALIGAFILLVSVQFYIDIQSALNSREDLMGSDFLVIQKKVGTASTLNLSRLGFSEEEIATIEKQDFVQEVGRFEANCFKVSAKLVGLPDNKEMLTDAFFEAVPDRFLDVKSDNWHWNSTAEEVPVILPGNYLDAYNYGFGPSQGLPPLSEKAFKMLKMEIRINGKERVIFKGRIAGFSDRINTILVPLPFLDFANAQYGITPPVPPSRLVLAVEDISHPALARFLEEHGYDTNQEGLKGSRAKMVLFIVLALFLFIGGLIVLLALLSFVQYMQILVQHIHYELKILMLMGYRPSKISFRYSGYILLIVTSVLLIAFVGFWLARSYFLEFTASYELAMPQEVSLFTWLVGGALFLFYVLTGSVSVFLNIRRLAKNLQ
jgi:hypothetical protein